MPELTAGQIAALGSRRLVRRDFVWIEAVDPNTGDPDPAGLWNDVGNVTVGGKTFLGAGILGGATLSATADLTIPALVLTLNGVDANAVALIRGDEIAQKPVTFYIGLFDPDAMTVIDTLIPVFNGRVDTCEIKSQAGGKASIVITCESSSRALTIKNPDTRSDASQKRRDEDDTFYYYTDVQRWQKIYFGRLGPRQQVPNEGPPVK